MMGIESTGKLSCSVLMSPNHKREQYLDDVVFPAIKSVGLVLHDVTTLSELFVNNLFDIFKKSDIYIIVINENGNLDEYMAEAVISILENLNKSIVCVSIKGKLKRMSVLKGDFRGQDSFVFKYNNYLGDNYENHQQKLIDLLNDAVRKRSNPVKNFDKISFPLLFSQLSSPCECGQGELPITLKRFHIKGFQCISDTHMDQLPPDAPWILITGDNGDGKTSLLQALALGLHGSEDGEHLLKNDYRVQVGVEIQLGDKYEVRNFFRWQTGWLLRDHEGREISPLRDFIAYGPFRLDMAAEATKARESMEKSPVYSLLQQRGHLRNVEHWLKMRLLERSKRSSLRVSHAIEILVALMPGVTRMRLVGAEFQYTEKGHVVGANQLSSGQVSLLAMVGDLLIRLYEAQPEVVEPKDLAGIVLIDELDVHLHPVRQKELPGQLSAIFPKVQFVATTHSVIPFMGAPKGSVFLHVRRDPKLGTQVERPEVEVGNLLPNAILTSPLFKMDSLLAKQNLQFSQVHTEDSYAEIERKKQVDAALAAFAKDGVLLPPDFLTIEE